MFQAPQPIFNTDILYKMKYLLFLLLLCVLTSPAYSYDASIAIGIPSQHVPFSYVDKTEYTGFDVELATQLADQVGIPYYFNPIPEEQLLDELEKGEIDIAIGAFSKAQVTDNFSHSPPYLSAGQVLLVRTGDKETKNLSDMAGRIVGTQLASDSAFYLYDNAPEVSVSMFPDIEHAYEELMRHEIDAVFYDSASISYFAATEGTGKVKTTGPIYDSTEYVIVFPKKSKWRRVFDQALSILKQTGAYDTLHAKWFGDMRGVNKINSEITLPTIRRKEATAR